MSERPAARRLQETLIRIWQRREPDEWLQIATGVGTLIALLTVAGWILLTLALDGSNDRVHAAPVRAQPVADQPVPRRAPSPSPEPTVSGGGGGGGGRGGGGGGVGGSADPCSLPQEVLEHGGFRMFSFWNDRDDPCGRPREVRRRR